ncbi:hypothetical protein NHX12_028645 [Muraenolepis orangiensis]|uniref:Gamma-glutamyltransferase n=1 Tax=Muraenolepis orangiensis TaxID=630683 RepID=A0A9Q0EAM2_9TELE|nr:hypothetical protein NHX12_028645 [Muraenolepis orangiensis]
MAWSKAMRVCACVLLLCSVVMLVVVIVMVSRASCAEGSYGRAAVAADSETCSTVGRDILRSGGSAVDGAIAALLCTSVVNPQSMGLGGGSIFTVMDGSGRVQIINARETVPKPTIRLAREGLPVGPVLARFITQLAGNFSPSLRKLYSDKNGNLLQVGDIIKFEKLADTLEVVAQQGADAFYNGKIAKDLIGDLLLEGSKLTMEDLAFYKARVSDAWNTSMGEYQLHLAPPPSGGVLLGLILNIMKGYDLTPESLRGEQKALTYHRFVEACKFANSLKKYARDPHFNSAVMAEKMTKESFADRLRGLISSGRSHGAQYYNTTPSMPSVGTTHVSVLDQEGMAVAVTSTINKIFGSEVYSASTGVLLNNQLKDFCGKAEHISAGEQPPSSMSPTIIRSRTKTLVTGASGGSMILTGTALEATTAPVVYVDSNNALKFEPDFDQSVIDALLLMGQTQKNTTYFYNVVNSVEKEHGCISAMSDRRKEGKAAGY